MVDAPPVGPTLSPTPEPTTSMVFVRTVTRSAPAIPERYLLSLHGQLLLLGLFICRCRASRSVEPRPESFRNTSPAQGFHPGPLLLFRTVQTILEDSLLSISLFRANDYWAARVEVANWGGGTEGDGGFTGSGDWSEVAPARLTLSPPFIRDGAEGRVWRWFQESGYNEVVLVSKREYDLLH